MSEAPPALQPRTRRQKVYRARWAIWGAALGIGLAIGAMVALSHKHSNASRRRLRRLDLARRRAACARLLADRRARQGLQPRLAARPARDRHLHRPALPRLLPARGEHPHRGRGQAGAERARDRLGQRRPLGRQPPRTSSADAAHWKLGPTWRWGTGTYAELARVWKPYAVGVEVTHKTIAGVKVRYITHTGAAYLIDAKGDERALFLYPFTTDQVVCRARRRLTAN